MPGSHFPRSGGSNRDRPEAALRNAGACAGTVTALALTQGPVDVTASLAIMAGGACAPVDSNLTEKEYLDYLSRLRPAALVWEETSSTVAAQAARQLGIAVIGLRVPRNGAAGVFEIAGVSAAAKHLDVRQTDQAMILETSATTGVPKLVPRSHAALATLASDNARGLRVEPCGPIPPSDLDLPRSRSGRDFRPTGEWRKTSSARRDSWRTTCGLVHSPARLVPGHSNHSSRDSASSRAKPEILARVSLRFLRTGGAPAGSELIQLRAALRCPGAGRLRPRRGPHRHPQPFILAEARARLAPPVLKSPSATNPGPFACRKRR